MTEQRTGARRRLTMGRMTSPIGDLEPWHTEDGTFHGKNDAGDQIDPGTHAGTLNPGHESAPLKAQT